MPSRRGTERGHSTGVQAVEFTEVLETSAHLTRNGCGGLDLLARTRRKSASGQQSRWCARACPPSASRSRACRGPVGSRVRHFVRSGRCLDCRRPARPRARTEVWSRRRLAGATSLTHGRTSRRRSGAVSTRAKTSPAHRGRRATDGPIEDRNPSSRQFRGCPRDGRNLHALGARDAKCTRRDSALLRNGARPMPFLAAHAVCGLLRRGNNDRR